MSLTPQIAAVPHTRRRLVCAAAVMADRQLTEPRALAAPSASALRAEIESMVLADLVGPAAGAKDVVELSFVLRRT